VAERRGGERARWQGTGMPGEEGRKGRDKGGKKQKELDLQVLVLVGREGEHERGAVDRRADGDA
jgi:hypothetical protein